MQHTRSGCLGQNSRIFGPSNSQRLLQAWTHVAQRKSCPSFQSKRQAVSRALAAADVEIAERTDASASTAQDSEVLSGRPERLRAELSNNGAEATTSGRQAGHENEEPADGWQHDSARPSRSAKQDSQKRPQSQLPKLGRRRGPVERFPYREGDIVVGTVIAGGNGWRVKLDDEPDILGFCMRSDLPHVLRKEVNTPQWGSTKYGIKRQFQIKHIPDDMEYNGKGPLLTARSVDLEVIWRRAEQILEACKQEDEIINVHINTVNKGGILGSFEGLATFVPFSYIPKVWGVEDCTVTDKAWLEGKFIGKEIPTSICDMDRNNNRFVGNMIRGLQAVAYHKLQVGDILWGKVHGIERFGVFVALDDYPTVRGLLHIGSISKSHVHSASDIFHKGESVRCIVAGLDVKNHYMNLSTAELEANEGDMIFNKAAVYENAEANAQDFLAWVKQRQEEMEDEEEIEEGPSSPVRAPMSSGDTLDW